MSTASQPLAPVFLATRAAAAAGRRWTKRPLACLTAVLLVAAAGAMAPGRSLLANEPNAATAAALARLDAILAAQPEDVTALVARGRLRESAGLPMLAYLDRREILRLRPEDPDVARLAAHNLLAAGAPTAAAELVERHPLALAGDAGAELGRRIASDLAARHIRWGWDEPIFDPLQRRHEAKAAIPSLEALRLSDPTDTRAAGDLMLAYRLAERMPDAIALWEEIGREDSPYWLRNAAADAYLALGESAKAEALYRGFAVERAATPQPWLGIYWAAIEQRHFADAEDAVDELAKIPGQQLAAEIRQGWLLLFADRSTAAQAHFESLSDRFPGDPEIRNGLVTSQLWQGRPRQGLRGLEELIARSGPGGPRLDTLPAHIARAGARSSLGDLFAARDDAESLLALYPDHLHAQRLVHDVDMALSPEARLIGRYDNSDRGLGESLAQVEVSTPLGTRTRLLAGTHQSRSSDDRYTVGDTEDAYLGLAIRPSRWLRADGEVAFDISRNGLDRDPAWRAGATLFLDDAWRVDAGWAHGMWRDLPLRARAVGLVADAANLGVSFTPSPRWSGHAGVGRSTVNDGNIRRWGTVRAQLLARQRSVYRAYFGAEVYGSENSLSDVPYYSPSSDRSAALTHRSEWVTANTAKHRHTLSLLLAAGIYDQQGFALGPVGGAWLQSDWDLTGRTVLTAGAGVRSQLYDGTRELEPSFHLTLRRRF